MDIAAPITIELTEGQQKLLKDIFGVTTTRLDILEELHELVKYRSLHKEAMSNLRAQRMYLEDAQKEQIANAMGKGMKADKMCDYIELDEEVILKYAALHKSGLLYAPPRKGD